MVYEPRGGIAMPIHTSWIKMIKGMGTQYPGSKVCRKLASGKQICVSKKAWSVFYGKINKMYGAGADAKAMPKKTATKKTKKVEETIENPNDWINWYMKGLKKDE